MTAPYYGYLDPVSKQLSNMTAYNGTQDSLPNYVPLLAMPTGAIGSKYTYDSVNESAVAAPPTPVPSLSGTFQLTGGGTITVVKGIITATTLKPVVTPIV